MALRAADKLTEDQYRAMRSASTFGSCGNNPKKFGYKKSTICGLVKRGLLICQNPYAPEKRFELTEAGKKLLALHDELRENQDQKERQTALRRWWDA